MVFINAMLGRERCGAGMGQARKYGAPCTLLSCERINMSGDNKQRQHNSTSHSPAEPSIVGGLLRAMRTRRLPREVSTSDCIGTPLNNIAGSKLNPRSGFDMPMPIKGSVSI